MTWTVVPRVPLVRRRSLRKLLRDRGQLSHLWKAQAGLGTDSEDCAAFSATNEPLINYLDVSREPQRGGSTLSLPEQWPMPKRFPQTPRLQAVPGVPGLAACPALCPRECEDEDKGRHSRQALPAPFLPAALCPPPWGQIYSKIQIFRAEHPGVGGVPQDNPIPQFPCPQSSCPVIPQGPAPQEEAGAVPTVPFVLSSHCCSLNICVLYSTWRCLAWQIKH